MTSKSNEFRFQHVLLGRDCIAIVLADGDELNYKGLDAVGVFKDFIKQNSVCFWNQCLVQSVNNLEFRGWLVPSTVLIGGSDFALEVVRSAWARRVLRPPKGYTICKLGDISVLELHPVAQTQFAPLSEALCKVVIELNSENMPATATTVASKLQESFPKIEVPSDEILYKTLGGLIKERKLYHTGEGYYVVNPNTYRQRAMSPLYERQMLMTNEEAIVRLHGEHRERSFAVQVDESDIAASWQCSSSSPASTLKQSLAPSSSPRPSSVDNSVSPNDLRVVERSHSLRVLRVKGKATPAREIFGRYGSFKDQVNRNEELSNSIENDSSEQQRCEKQSMLGRLFRRMQSLTDKSNKQTSLSAQYPPLEWFGSKQLHCHSVATQTQLQFRKFQSKTNERKSLNNDPVPIKMIWPQMQNEGDKILSSSQPLSKGLLGETDTQYIHKKGNQCSRPVTAKYTPSHRHSYATFSHHAKRHHYRHRRSSSESPKIEKSKKNETDVLYEYKLDNLQKPLGNWTSNPKAIISPCTIVYKQTQPTTVPLNVSSVNTAPLPSINTCVAAPISVSKTKFSSPLINSTNDVIINIPKSVSLVTQANGFNLNPKKRTKFQDESVTHQVSHSRSNSISSSEIKLSASESNSDPLIHNDGKLPKKNNVTKPVIIKDTEEVPELAKDSTPLKKSNVPKEILIDNSVNVEVAVEKSLPKTKTDNLSTTVCQTVTEETTVKKGSGKVVTVTSVTTSLTHGSTKDSEKPCSEKKLSNVEKEEMHKVNDLNLERAKKCHPCIIDCSSSCNITTEMN